MKKAISRKLTALQKADLARLSSMRDEDIDLSDAPEARDWTGAKRGKFYKPVKQQLTLRLDADVVDWFKRQGAGYQTEINNVLRRHVGRKAG